MRTEETLQLRLQCHSLQDTRLGTILTIKKRERPIDRQLNITQGTSTLVEVPLNYAPGCLSLSYYLCCVNYLLDLLFNDWGIHHLHLRSDKENPSDYFNGRTGLLLFVKFTIDTAYFLDIKSHDDWSNTDFIRIIQRNWPEIIADREIPNTQWSPNFNDEKIGILRKKGYLFGINVDEKAYLILGHGRTSSGDNAMAIRLANEVWRWVGENKHLFDTNLDTFKLGLNEQLHI